MVFSDYAYDHLIHIFVILLYINNKCYFLITECLTDYLDDMILNNKKFNYRTRFNNYMNTARWNPAKVSANNTCELLHSLELTKKDTIYLILDDSKKGKRCKKDGCP